VAEALALDDLDRPVINGMIFERGHEKLHRRLLSVSMNYS
jgi:hypothetical protein